MEKELGNNLLEKVERKQRRRNLIILIKPTTFARYEGLYRNYIENSL